MYQLVIKYQFISFRLFRSLSGEGGKSLIEMDEDLSIEFQATSDRESFWRTDLAEGQLPYFLVWPLS